MDRLLMSLGSIFQIKEFINGLIFRGEYPTWCLKKMGLRVGKNFKRRSGCIIDCSFCWLISIGDNVTLAPKVHILAHDASTKMYLNYTKIGLVSIGHNVFIGTGTIVMPNVKIGDNVIIGAGSVVTSDIPANSYAAGNPTRVIGNTDEYISKYRSSMETRPVYDHRWTLGRATRLQKQIMIEKLRDGIGYIE